MDTWLKKKKEKRKNQIKGTINDREAESERNRREREKRGVERENFLSKIYGIQTVGFDSCHSRVIRNQQYL